MPSRGASVVKLEPETHTRDPFDFPPNTASVTYEGVEYKFRELTVGETDVAREASTSGDMFDGRLMTRLMVTAGAVDPKMTLEDLTKLPQRLYSAIVDKVNELNDPDALAPKKEEGAGN